MNRIRVPCIAKSNLKPEYRSTGAAGADLRADIDNEITLRVGERKIISTGVNVQIPSGFEAQIRPRSGLAMKHGVTVLNSPGTVDSDYRGEIQVILINLGDSPFTIKRGDRIAQIVFSHFWQAEFLPQTSIDGTNRGESGFGSTGI